MSAVHNVAVDSDLLGEHLTTLAKHGAYGDGGVWRVAFSSEWDAAQKQVAEWFSESGLTPRRDAAGNVWGRLEGKSDAPAVVTGSHIDSQTPGGRFDGALGVAGGLAAVAALASQLGRPERTIEVVSFSEEEASRFRTANMWGSRAVTGGVRHEDLTEIRDADGVSIGEAMHQVGLDAARIDEATRSDVDSFVELHIEQGPQLEQAGVPVGVVTGISGVRQYEIQLEGRADHAGAYPMAGRRDAMEGAAEIVLGVINGARAMGHPAVTTVGKLNVRPGIPSAVPESVSLTIDARHSEQRSLDLLLVQHEALIMRIGEAHALGVSWERAFDLAPVDCDSGLVQLIEHAANSCGVPTMRLVSGAVHDAMRMAAIARTAMIFVRSKDGRSHTPEEFTSHADAVAGADVLANALRALAYV